MSMSPWKPWQTPTGRINMQIRKPENAPLKDASSNNINISGKGTSVVREEHCFPYKIKIIVSTSLGQEELLVVLKNLKILNIYKDFPKTLPGYRRDSYNSIMPWGTSGRMTLMQLRSKKLH